MKVELLSIGTELLLGDIVNTNAHFLSNELRSLGIDVYYQTVVGDNEERIFNCFKDAFDRADVVITTGGLGPTVDDLTKEIAAKYFNKELVLHEESLNDIKEFFDRMGKVCDESNKKQAMFPVDSIILKNNNGTAPGAIMENEDGKVIIILPGPPREMKPMFKEQVVPYLRKKSPYIMESKMLRMMGIGESEMESRVRDIINESTNPTVAPYAKENDVILRITAKGKSGEEVNDLIEPVDKKIRSVLGEYIYGEDDDTIEDVVGKLLTEKNITIATAESCTGGMVGAKLINYPGISSVYLQGAITYSNEAKMQELKVNKETLDKYGAVSHETAREMALGICNKSGARVGIATTGIAGPGGGTEEKPVGLVYFGICIDGDVKTFKYIFNGNRQKVRERATNTVLNLLRIELSKK
ncbi:MAG: competence/damage-inducible protein A [Clostridium sp.]